MNAPQLFAVGATLPGAGFDRPALVLVVPGAGAFRGAMPVPGATGPLELVPMTNADVRALVYACEDLLRPRLVDDRRAGAP